MMHKNGNYPCESGAMETGQQNLKDPLNQELVPRKIGDDGSYYECVICDNGGDLLCCETCPNVYHLWCLNPPLEHVPSGEWRCSNCKESHPSEVVDEKEYDTKISKLGKATVAPLSGDGAGNAFVSRKGKKASELNPLKVYRRSKFKNQGRKEEDDIKFKHEPGRKKDKGETMPLELLANVFTNSRLKNICEIKEHAKEEENWPCEEELDSLWIGVRRHGQNSWETILNDPILKFSYFRTPTSLAERWRVERLKVESEIIQDPCISKKGASSSSMILPDGSTLLSKKRVAVNNGKAKAKKRVILETSDDDHSTLLSKKRVAFNNGKAKAKKRVILDRDTSKETQSLV